MFGVFLVKLTIQYRFLQQPQQPIVLLEPMQMVVPVLHKLQLPSMLSQRLVSMLVQVQFAQEKMQCLQLQELLEQ